MKNLIIIFCFILSATVSSAQEKNQIKYAIANSTFNTLIAGFDNPVNIVVSHTNPEDIEITVSHGTITKINSENANYLIRSDQVGVLRVTVYEKGKSIGSRQFRVKKIAKSKAVIGFHRGEYITKELLLTLGAIDVLIPGNDYYDIKPVVMKHKLFIYMNDYDFSISSAVAQFSDKQVEAIKNLNSGDKISFRDITVKLPDGTVSNLNDISLTIK